MFPPEVSRLFWDVDVARLDLERDRDYVLERVMCRGELAAMRWLLATYSRMQLAEFLDRRSERLPPRERAFWSLMAGRPAPSVPGGGRPAWAG